MRVRELTRPNSGLAHIFWNIRSERRPNVRRSWQRRARQALATRGDLTPAEQHEVIAVWSRHDCHLIDSPALRKITG